MLRMFFSDGSEDMVAFHGLDDDGSALSIKLALRKDRLAEVWMAWRDEVRFLAVWIINL